MSDPERRSRAAACAEAAGLPVAKCDVIKYGLGGGFGRRRMSDYVRQVVLIAKQMPGTPVKLVWSREEDMMHDFYHPISQCKLTAGFDTAGNLTALHMRISGQSILAYVFPANLQNGMDPAVFQGLTPNSPEGHFGYSVPNLLIDHAMRNTVVRPGFWRGVNTNQNAIYVECFIDELAHAAGQDPLAFRQKLLADHPKHLAVLNAVADRVGWGKPAPPASIGLAQFMGYGSYVAAAAEVSVANGRLKSIASSPPPTAATRSIRRRSSGRLRARSCMASRLPSTANALSRTAAWSKRTSTLTT